MGDPAGSRGGAGCGVLTVVSPGLGTLNHTALTLEALAKQKGLSSAGLVIGSWPAAPGPAERSNVDEAGAAGSGAGRAPGRWGAPVRDRIHGVECARLRARSGSGSGVR